MAWKNETLHRGLHNIIDPAVAPEGSLQEATNCRYHPDDPSIWQAEGRQIIADGLHGVSQAVPAVAGLQWDPGSGNELEQILYPGLTQFTTIPAAADAGDTSMNSTSATTYTTPTGVVPSLTSGILVPIQFENEHFILTGGDNMKFSRSSGTQTLSRHGMPATTFSATTPRTINIYRASTSTGLSIATGFYYFWVTWYDSTNDIEGGSVSDGAIWMLITSDVTNNYIEIWLDKTIYEANKPDSADTVRIYYSGPYETELAAESGAATSRSNPWPTGYLLGAVTPTLAVDDLSGDNEQGYRIRITVSGGTPATNELELIQDQFDNPSLWYTSYADNVVAAGGAYADKNGVPPNATTGDVFEESLVLNDVNDLRKIKFSFPGSPEAFPSVFYVNFETEEWDKVVAIKTLGNKLGVFLANSVWRVNWLPSTSDLDYGRGRVKDLVVSGRGSYSHNSVTRFTMGGQSLLAYVSKTGLYATDLYTEIKLSRNVNWASIIGTRDPSSLLLVDDPDNERLILAQQGWLYYFHYDQMHLVDGIPAVTGPLNRPAGIKAMSLVRVSGGSQKVITTGTLGTAMHYDGEGYTDESNTGIPLVMSVKSRDIYPFGAGNEGHIRQFMAHIKPSSIGTGTWNAKMNAWLSGTGTPTIKISPTITVNARQLKISTGRALAEFYNVEFVGTSTQAASAVNFFGVEGQPLDEAESR